MELREQTGCKKVMGEQGKKLRKKSRVDILTTLYAGDAFIEDFMQLVEDNLFREIGMFILEIDDFKQYSRIYGSDMGDQVLKDVTRILLELVPEKIRLYYLKGGRFGIFLKYPTESNVRKLFDAMCRKIACYRRDEEPHIQVSVSAGYAEYPKDASVYIDLYKYADYSLQYAKEHGKALLEVFSEEIFVYESRKLEMLRLLRNSIDENFKGFHLVFRPTVDRETKNIQGVETLIKWENEAFGEVDSDEFIPILEENGLLNILGKWVAQTGLAVLKKWDTSGWELDIGLKILHSQMKDESYVDEIIRMIEWSGMDTGRVIFELVNSSQINMSEPLRAGLQKVGKSGIRVMLDNFGVNYAAIGLLKSELVDMIKIDRTIGERVKSDSFDLKFVRFISEICHEMGIEVCLEGVTDMEELKCLEGIHLDCLQGDLFGKPKTVEFVLEEWRQREKDEFD